MRKQHDQIDIVETGKSIDRGAAGIARGCDHDGGALRPLSEHVIHQPRDQLHRDVLERQRRAVKQLQQELIGPDLIERNHRGVTECGVGLVGHAPEIGVGNLVTDKRADHIDRDFPIGPAEKSGDGLGRKLRPRFGHVKAAVAGKPGQHHVAETQDRGLPPRRNISRQTALQRLRLPAKPLISINNITLPMTKSRGTIKRFPRKWKPVLLPASSKPPRKPRRKPPTKPSRKPFRLGMISASDRLPAGSIRGTRRRKGTQSAPPGRLVTGLARGPCAVHFCRKNATNQPVESR